MVTPGIFNYLLHLSSVWIENYSTTFHLTFVIWEACIKPLQKKKVVWITSFLIIRMKQNISHKSLYHLGQGGLFFVGSFYKNSSFVDSTNGIHVIPPNYSTLKHFWINWTVLFNQPKKCFCCSIITTMGILKKTMESNLYVK